MTSADYDTMISDRVSGDRYGPEAGLSGPQAPAPVSSVSSASAGVGGGPSPVTSSQIQLASGKSHPAS